MTERAIDKVIREAIERGEFDNLPGAGKPLDLSDADDPDWWIKRLIKREQLDLSGGLPGVFGLRRERESFPESLIALRTEAAVREVLEDYNRRVKIDRIANLPAKGAAVPIIAPLVHVEEMLNQWATRRAQFETQAQEAAAGGRRLVAGSAHRLGHGSIKGPTGSPAIGSPPLRDRLACWWRRLTTPPNR